MWAERKTRGLNFSLRVSERESQAKDHGNENTRDGKDTAHDGSQRTLQERLDKQHRASVPGMFFLEHAVKLEICEKESLHVNSLIEFAPIYLYR